MRLSLRLHKTHLLAKRLVFVGTSKTMQWRQHKCVNDSTVSLDLFGGVGDASAFYENARLTQFSWLSTRTQLTRPFDRQDMLGGLVMLASLTPLAHSLVLMSFMLD